MNDICKGSFKDGGERNLLIFYFFYKIAVHRKRILVAKVGSIASLSGVYGRCRDWLACDWLMFRLDVIG